MVGSILEILVSQIMLFTESGTASIESPNFMIQETYKISGKSRKEVILLFKLLDNSP